MLMPQTQQYTEIAVNRIGPQFGYWDPRFAGSAAKVLMTSVCAVIVVSLAVFDWLTVHAARLIDRLTQTDSFKPPSFGYFATTVAGNMVGLSVLTGLIAIAAQPLSAPAWQWVSHPGEAQSLVIVLAAGAAYFGQMRWQVISARRDQEIFGSRLKGFLARMGTCLVGFGILCALAHPL
jgi:hypothetical protein